VSVFRVWLLASTPVVQGQGGTVDITELILDDHHEQRQPEQDQRPRATGSLSIGSLKGQ
jgi:hypothetical protein